MEHYDWLTLSEHHETAPELGDRRVIWVDFESNELLCESVSRKTVVGSWDTSLQVSSAGGVVRVSGNPSKWGRLDAVTGLSTMEECLDVFNSVLDALGLPRFSGYNWTVPLPNGERQVRGTLVSRVDITRNILTGDGTARARFLDFLSAYRWGRLPPDRRAAGTVYWGKRGRRLLRCYDKGAEIRAHIGRTTAQLAPTDRDEAREYLGALADWCDSVGLIREEVELGRKHLHDREWSNIASWYGADLAERMGETVRETAIGGAMVTDWKSQVFDRVEASTGSERMARTARDMLLAWMAGADVSEGVSRRTFYRYARLLRDAASVDIREAPNVVSLSTRVRSVEVEARPLTARDLPEFYRAA